MSRPIPPSYKTKNWPDSSESSVAMCSRRMAKALKQRGSLTIWCDPAMVRVPPPTGTRGRQLQNGDAAIRTRLTLKPLFGMVRRQTTGVVERLLRLVGLDRTVPDFSTLSRLQWSDPDKLLDLLGFRKNHANENAQKNPNWEVH